MRLRSHWSFVGFAMLVAAQGSCGGEEGIRDTRGSEQGTAVSFDGVPISYRAVGSGHATLVLIHGWSCDQSYWAAQVEPFADRFRVVTLDLAGHGASGVDRRAWTIASFGADVAAVVDHLELESVLLVGHSMGGDVAVSAARLLGDRVVGIVWIDTYSQLGAVRTAEEVSAMLAPFRRSFSDSTYAFVQRVLFPPSADPALVERVARDMAAAPSDIAAASLRSSIMNDRVVPSVLAKLDLPVVSINPASSNPDVESLQRHGVEVIVIPDLGHFMMMEDPEAFNAVLENVVAGMLQ